MRSIVRSPFFAGARAGKRRPGIAGTVAGGYEWWIGTQWSVGLLARLTYAGLIFENEDIDERHNVFVPGPVTTFTHH